MVTTSEIRVDAAFTDLPERKPRLKTLLGHARRMPLGAAGAAVVVVMGLAALFAGIIAPHNPVANDFASMLQAPSWNHPLGTDQFGRDILSRIIYGARTALYVGSVSALIGGTAGLVLGVASAYFGGWIALVFQRLMDVFMAFRKEELRVGNGGVRTCRSRWCA